MSPRKYDMGKRAAAVEETRRRIVEATMSLHDEQGVAATSWDQIAERAGVGVGTVYRHFPSYDELLPACGAPTLARLAPPDPAGAPALFAGAADTDERLRRLVDEVYGIYERGGVIVETIRRERDVHANLADADEVIERSIDALVAEALRPLRPSAEQRRTVRALLDVGTWRALERSGLAPGAARDAVAGLLRGSLGAPRD
jgi:AcrR family transcriptional regulator